MKKLFFFLAALTLSFTAHAAVVNIDPSSEGNLRRGIRDKVQAGDTLVLADGEYDESQSVTLDKEGLVIMAADGAKPVIKAKSYMKHYATTTIIGITFDGGGTAEHGFYSYENTNKSLTLIDCEIGNYAQYLINASTSAHIDSLIIEGCLLHDCGDAAVYMTNTDALPDGLPICSYFKMTNSTIYNINGEQYYGAIDIRENKSAYGAGGTEVIVDHVTLYNYKNPQGGFYIYKSPKLTITNTIVANPTEGPAAFYIYGGTVDNSLYFNGSADSRGTYTECIAEQDPLFMDPTNGNFNLQPGSPVIGKATDGTNMGDPRWKVAAAELAFAMAAPAADVEATDLYTIKWTVLDPDGDATIKLEYKAEEGDWTLIEENIPTTKSAYDWNIRKMAAQTVAIRGTLTNATETIESVAAGKLTIVPEAVAPRPVRNLAGEVAENTLTLTWVNPDQAYEVSETLETLESAESYISNDGTAEVTLSGDKKEVSVAYNTTAAWHMAGVKVPVTADYVNTLACELKRDAADGTQIQVTIEQNGFDWWYLIIDDIATEWTEYDFTEFEKVSWHNNSDAAVLDGTNVTAVYFATNHGSGVSGTLSLRNLTLNGAVPAVTDYAKTVICISEVAYPTTIVAEEVVYEGAASTYTLNIDPTKDLYVSVFAQDDLGNTSVAAQYKYTAPAVEEHTITLSGLLKYSNEFRGYTTLQNVEGDTAFFVYNYVDGVPAYGEGYSVTANLGDLTLEGTGSWKLIDELETITAVLYNEERTAVYNVTVSAKAPEVHNLTCTDALYVENISEWMSELRITGVIDEAALTISVYDWQEATAGTYYQVMGVLNDEVYIQPESAEVTIVDTKLTIAFSAVDEFGNTYNVNVTATPKPNTPFVVENATFTVDGDNLTIQGQWETKSVVVALGGWSTTKYGKYNAVLMTGTGEADDDIYAEFSAVLSKDGTTATLTGVAANWDGTKYDVTISGLAPAEAPTALDNVDTTVAPAKAIVNGQLVIIKNGVQYNAQGAVVK